MPTSRSTPPSNSSPLVWIEKDIRTESYNLDEYADSLSDVADLWVLLLGYPCKWPREWDYLDDRPENS